jgi:hypothetical protein
VNGGGDGDNDDDEGKQLYVQPWWWWHKGTSGRLNPQTPSKYESTRTKQAQLSQGEPFFSGIEWEAHTKHFEFKIHINNCL